MLKIIYNIKKINFILKPFFFSLKIILSSLNFKTSLVIYLFIKLKIIIISLI